MDLCLFVFEFAKFLRQTPVESFVQPAKKFDRANLTRRHGAQPCFHLRLNLNMGEVLNLERTLCGVCGKILPQRRVNVPGPRAMAFDKVRVVTVHRAHQVGDQCAGNGMQRSPQPFRTPDERQSRGRRSCVTVSRPERLHVRWTMVKCFAGGSCAHLCRYFCRLNKAHKMPVCKHLFEQKAWLQANILPILLPIFSVNILSQQ